MILNVNGLLRESTDSLDLLSRAVIISLFSWRRAESDDQTTEPYGWWGDTWPTIGNDRIGSRLYLLRRTKITNKTAVDARGYIEQALSWIIEDGVAAKMIVETSRAGLDILYASVTLFDRDGNKHTITFDDIWSEIND
ncbi:TPA: phage GP46 family protein [Enterobacter roggenkampii]